MNKEFWQVELGQGMGCLLLGATREEVLKRLAEAQVKVDVEEEEPDWLYILELDAELSFTTTPPHRLREIAVEDERLRLGPLTVIGERLHQVIEALQISDSETLWQGDEEKGEADVTPAATGSPPAGDSHAQVPSDKELLNLGTLWIRPLGLGLGLFRGEVCTVTLRKPEETPARGIGPLKAAQRELSAREGLFDELSRASGVSQSPATGPLPKLLTLALFAALGLLAWRAVEYQRRWNATPIVAGEVIAVQPPPPEPFPEKFTIAYRDLAGQDHQVVLKSTELYGLHKLGDKVELRFLPEAPDRPLGPAQVRDAGIDKCMPWGIGIFMAYIALQIIIPLTGWVLGRIHAIQRPPSES